MKDIYNSRFKEAPWSNAKEVMPMIGGCGGIGSWLSLLLTRAGSTPYIIDFDRIEEHNIGGQLFRTNSVGQLKITAIREVIREFCEVFCFTDEIRLTENTPATAVCFSAFDNMTARKLMFEAWSKRDDKELFIDGRLSAEYMEIYCIGNDPEEIEKYKSTLFEDTEIPDEPCTMKQTSHAAAMIASHMVGFYTNYLTNKKEREEVRKVPFKWSYFIPLNLIEEVEDARDFKISEGYSIC